MFIFDLITILLLIKAHFDTNDEIIIIENLFIYCFFRQFKVIFIYFITQLIVTLSQDLTNFSVFLVVKYERVLGRRKVLAPALTDSLFFPYGYISGLLGIIAIYLIHHFNLLNSLIRFVLVKINKIGNVIFTNAFFKWFKITKLCIN